ncbi:MULTISPECIES: glycosyltransferase family 2 protein [Sphingobacterium]|uniref:Glycosyltransferase family 2 protein n=1 Tax=Sphingobacterium populi TaxID=1812824 RepID=A0ABW5UE34_9SPHI|nr:glycosyltransferase [Sphingobacterium sp. CFCC 11742]
MVSIIIPNFNHAKFLEQRINSVLNQSYLDFELIILDDASSDGSRLVIDRYKDHPKVSHIIYNEKNSGSTFKQWKKGLLLAKGELIWIAESDDVADPDFLKTLIERIKTHPKAVISYCGSNVIDEKGVFIEKEAWAVGSSKRNWDQDFISNGSDEIRNEMYFKCSIPNASAAVFQKSKVDMLVFNEIESMHFAGDWLFWIRLMEKGDVLYTAKRLNNFRKHASTTRSLQNPALETRRINEYLKVINYLRCRYKLAWNRKKHRWMITEWADKYSTVTGSTFAFFRSDFPPAYNMRLVVRVVKNLIFSSTNR